MRTPSEPRADSALVDTLKAQIAALEAHVETLKAQLAAAEARLVELDARHVADLAQERERANRAISAFEALVQRLEAMAEARRPWWRRLTSALAWGKGGT